MAEPLSLDLRERVVEAVKGGMSRRGAAAHFRVGVSSAIRWVTQAEAGGDLRPKPMGGAFSRRKRCCSFRCCATVAGAQALPRERDPLAYDPDWDEDARLEEWRQSLGETRSLQATLAAAIALEAWSAIEPLQRQPWLGREAGQLRRHNAGAAFVVP